MPRFELRSGQNANGGQRQTGVTSVEDCMNACRANGCVMFDFDTSFKECFLHNRNRTLKSSPGVNNYLYITCQGRYIQVRIGGGESGGVQGTIPPLLAHSVGFLTLDPKLDPLNPYFLREDLSWIPPLSKILHPPVIIGWNAGFIKRPIPYPGK